MTDNGARPDLTHENFDAFLFDLDGVITSTAKVHSHAWKELFDGYLKTLADKTGKEFIPFTDEDYRVFVDGKPRYEGVRSFLESRGVSLPFGDPSDAEDAETCCGLGNKKNAYFNVYLQEEGAEVFETSVQFVRQLLAQGFKTAVVSSSKNCQTVLQVAGIEDLFQLRMDGAVAEAEGIPGKPEPDTFVIAAERLGVPVSRAVVVEDSISGVQSGASGNFGLIIGVDRTGEAVELRKNGAHFVVEDLGELLGGVEA